MSIEPPGPANQEESEEPEEPPRDEPWDELRAAIEAALNMGLTDVSDLTDMINRARNEDLRAAFNDATAQLAERMTRWRATLEPFRRMINARDILAERQSQTEKTLLERIAEVSKETDSPDGLYALAAAYAQLRSMSVAPGWYVPDIRHTDKPATQEQ